MTKPGTTLWYVSLLHVFAGVLITLYVVEGRARFQRYSQSIKAILIGIACLAVAPLLGLTEGGDFTPHQLTSLYSMNSSAQFGASRMVGIGYLVLLYGIETLPIVASNRHKANTRES